MLPQSPFIFVCDHATNDIPTEYNNLGLSHDQLNAHISYDLGAYDVAQYLSQHFQAPLLSGTASRLLIDPNRGLDDPTLIPALVDRIIIPGNLYLSEKERIKRIESFYTPYHQAITTEIEILTKKEVSPVLISIHTFTPIYKGQIRDIELGFLLDTDTRVLDVINVSTHFKSWHTANNKPYDGVYKGDCMHTHGTIRGLAHILFEIRNDIASNISARSDLLKSIILALTQVINQYPMGWPAQFQGTRAK